MRGVDAITIDLGGGEFQLNFADHTVSLFSAYEVVFHSPSEHRYIG